MKEKKLGRYLLLELKDNELMLYKKWNNGGCFESTDNYYKSDNNELLNSLFQKINTKNVYQTFKELKEKRDIK